MTPTRNRTLLSSVITALLLGAGMGAHASSHREAPFIAMMPALDGTDLYMFRSYEAGREAYVTLIANYIPDQSPSGGPNFFDLDPDALYEIHIDNDGDSVEDLTFSFNFETRLAGVTVPVGGKNVPIPLVNAGPVGPTASDTAAVNSRQEFTVNLVKGNRRTGTVMPLRNSATNATAFRKPLDNIGDKSIPEYTQYAASHIYDVAIPGCGMPGRVFVGQRKEGFAVNLGGVFDLVNLNPLGAKDAVPNTLRDKNVTSLALEVPVDCLVENDPVIGAWTTSSMISADGEALQVSRLGFPLINELVIGLPDKDRFNSSEPKDDAQFATYVTNPTLPFLLELLFSEAGAKAPSNFPRMDLAQAIGGVTGLNVPKAVAEGKFSRSEMLRLNTDIAYSGPEQQSNLGVLGNDLAGFPNGRRPGDDVVDIALRVMMGALIADTKVAPNNTAPFTDQTSVSVTDFDLKFPYLTTPLPGAGSN